MLIYYPCNSSLVLFINTESIKEMEHKIEKMESATTEVPTVKVDADFLKAVEGGCKYRSCYYLGICWNML